MEAILLRYKEITKQAPFLCLRAISNRPIFLMLVLGLFSFCMKIQSEGLLVLTPEAALPRHAAWYLKPCRSWWDAQPLGRKAESSFCYHHVGLRFYSILFHSIAPTSAWCPGFKKRSSTENHQMLHFFKKARNKPTSEFLLFLHCFFTQLLLWNASSAMWVFS